MELKDAEASLAKSIDPTLAQQIINEATELEEAFALKRWKYTELDGGRFAEVAARIVYSVDSGNVNLTKSVDDCLKYIDNQQVPHHFPEPQGAIHLSKVIRAIYKLRSQRGAVHVSPTYTANEIDSRLIVEAVRWTLSETFRIFAKANRAQVVTLVQELSRFPHPLIRNYGGQPLLQSVAFSTEEEILVHLLSDRDGLTSAQLVKFIPKDPSGVRRYVKRLAEAKIRQVVQVGDKWQVTDLGIARIEARIIVENSKSR